MFKRCFIIGSGNSLQEGIDKGLQFLLENEVVFTLNEEFRFFESTATFFNDWTFYKCRYDLLKNHPLIIGRFDGAFERGDCLYLPQLILLPSFSKYVGVDSWSRGFYTGMLSGAFTLTFAIALGFEEIYCLGFDGQAINGKTHHYEGQDGFGVFTDTNGKSRTGVGIKNGRYNTGIFNKNRKLFNQELWDAYKPELERIKIYNVSLDSKIDTFPKISYDEMIKIIKESPINIYQDFIREQIKEYIKNNAKFNKDYFYNSD